MENFKNKKCIEFFKKYWLDVILIIILIIASIAIRWPSTMLNDIKEENRDYYKNEEGALYLHDMDSYYFASVAKKIINNEVSISKSNSLSAVAFIIYKVLNIFTKISLDKLICYIGPYINALAVIPAYIFVKKRTNRIGGLAAGFMAGCNTPFILYTCFGNFDTDILLSVLPLISMCSFIEVLQKKEIKKQLIWSVISSISFLGIVWTQSASSYSLYYYIPLVIFATILFIIFIKEKANIKNIIKHTEIRGGFICCILYTIIFISLIGNIDTHAISYVMNLLKESNIATSNIETSNVSTVNTAISTAIYPSSEKYIGELSSIPLIDVEFFSDLFNVVCHGAINRIGGITIVILSLYAIIMLIVKIIINLKNKNLNEINKNYTLFISLIIWTVITAFCVKFGVRFLKTCSIPIGLLTGLGIGFLADLQIVKKFNLKFLVIIVTIICVVMPLSGGYQFAKRMEPKIDDSVINASNWIKNNTDKNAIIVSWWDLGYLYEYQAERDVVSDGGTLDGRYYYWLANIFMTEDAKLAKGISKMLSNAGVNASYMADSLMGDSKKGSEMLKEVLVLEKEEAKEVLTTKYLLKNEEMEELIKLTHPGNDRELIILVSEDMLSMISAISYYGNWNFDNKENIKEESEEKTMIYRLYYEEDDIDDILEHKHREVDPNDEYTINIWKIK